MTTARNLFTLTFALLGYLGVMHMAHGATPANTHGKCTFTTLADGNTMIVCPK